jgi:hypothetical protein
MADILVATPFNVPKIFKLEALLVRRMVEHGKEKIAQNPLADMSSNVTPWRREFVGRSAVKGCAMYTIGNTIAQPLRQLRTPYFLAIGGKTAN